MRFRKKSSGSAEPDSQASPASDKPATAIKTESLFRGVMLAHLILALHVVLMAGVGIVVLFFRGVTSYMLYIFLVFLLIFLLVIFYVYRRARREGQHLKDALRSPAFNGRAVEISFLGGLAAFRLGRESALQLEHYSNGSSQPPPLLEDPARMRLREISELARLLENNLITQEEYDQMKQQLLHPKEYFS